MSNFEDFDLDLKQVSTTTNTELLSTTTILQSLATTCIYHVQHQCWEQKIVEDFLRLL